MKCKFLILGIIFLIILIILNNSQNISRTSDKSNIKIDKNPDIIYGSTDAKIKIFEYSDFNCPDCKKLHNNIKKFIQNSITQGKIQYILKPINEIAYYNLEKEINKQFTNLDKYYNLNYLENNKINQKNIDEIGNHEYQNRINNSRIIKDELERLKISSIPTLYINNRKIVGVYNVNDIEEIIINEINSTK